MLRTILSIAGRPGLYKLISQGKNMIVVESLTDGKRAPVYAHEKVISMGDIAIYTIGQEVPLRVVFKSIAEKENNSTVSISLKVNKAMAAYFAEVLPTYDRERVYPNDIKKVLSWYNALLNAGITDFEDKEENSSEENQENQ